MRGGALFLMFLVFFTLTTLIVPIPLFPGNMMCLVFSSVGIPASFYTSLFDALANGMFYGLIVWIVYVLINRKLEEQTVINPRDSSCTLLPEGSVNCPASFGYLRKLQPGSSVPEKCYECPRLDDCVYG